jgi:hypothetical protein
LILLVLLPSIALSADSRIRANMHPVRRPMLVGDFDTVIPHFVDGAGWQTTILLTNLTNHTAYFAILFSADNGDLTDFPIADLGPANSIIGQLAANESAEIPTAGTGAARIQGSAQIFCLDKWADDPTATVVKSTIGGYAIFRQHVESGRPDFEAVVPINPTFESKFTLFFDNRNGYSTGVAIINGGMDPSPVSIVARDFQGNQLLSDQITLQGSEKVVFSVPERYKSLAGQSGILQFSTANISLSGMGLRFNPGGAFTSAHSLSLAE